MAVHRPDPRLLERQIASLSAQTESSWECLIGIDGADAKTLDLVNGLVAHDPRLTARAFADNVGVYRHFERLLREIPDEASWVALADQDDVWHPTKLARLAEVVADPGVTAAMCQARLVDPEGRLLGHTERKAGGLVDLLLRNQVTGSLAVFSATTIRRSLPFPAGTSEAIHDHWLAVCAASQGDVRLLQEHLQDYVQHESNVLGEETPTSLHDTLTAVRRSGGVRAHVGTIARERWGWRVSLARGLEDADLVPPDVKTFVGTVADGRFSMTLVWSVVGSWWAGRLRARAVPGMLVSAWWFAVRLRGSHIGRGVEA